jgi:hypothetical protein
VAAMVAITKTTVTTVMVGTTDNNKKATAEDMADGGGNGVSAVSDDDDDDSSDSDGGADCGCKLWQSWPRRGQRMAAAGSGVGEVCDGRASLWHASVGTLSIISFLSEEAFTDHGGTGLSRQKERPDG